MPPQPRNSTPRVIQGNRRIDVETRIEIARPAAEVFEMVSDQTNAPRWQQGLHEVRRTTPGPIGVGTEHVFTRRFAGMRIESRNRFTGYEPGRFVSFEIPSGRITGEAWYLVEPTGTDTCRLLSGMHFRVSGLVGLAAPVLARVLARDSRRDEQTLRKLLEDDDAVATGDAEGEPEARVAQAMPEPRPID